MKVVAEIEGHLKIYSDGSVLRLPHPTTPASSHFTDGVRSKDVTINPETGVWARIFMPETASRKLPVLIHFHGGGFTVCSTAFVEFHNYFHALCKTAGIIVVSVDYRLAPEHRLPAAYDDCTEAVEWIAKHAAGRAEVSEEWLSPSVIDFSRCFLAGESPGGNIVYHVGLRVADMDLRPLIVKGVIAIHPFFGSEEMVESEKRPEVLKCVEMLKSLWSVSLPVGSTRDHPFCNPAVSPFKPGLKLPPVPDEVPDEWLSPSERAEVPDEWLSPSAVDFSRCFLAGESAGGNIVYHVGLRVADMDLRPLIVKGVIAIHPFFGSEEMVESEKRPEVLKYVEMLKSLWSVSLPVGSTRDHPFCNPAVSPVKPGLKLPPVLVAVAGKDELYERGVMFYEFLKSCGKEAELMVEESGVHTYHIFLPQYEGSPRFIQRISDFVNNS